MAKLNPRDIIMTFVLLIIGASLVSVVGSTVWSAQFDIAGGATNVTGASAAILSLLTLFFVIIVIMIAVKKIR